MKILSSFTNPLFIPSLYDQLLQNTKENILKNVGRSYGYHRLCTDKKEKRKKYNFSKHILCSREERNSYRFWMKLMKWWCILTFLWTDLCHTTKETNNLSIKKGPKKAIKLSCFRKSLIIPKLWKSSRIGMNIRVIRKWENYWQICFEIFRYKLDSFHLALANRIRTMAFTCSHLLTGLQGERYRQLIFKAL